MPFAAKGVRHHAAWCGDGNAASASNTFLCGFLQRWTRPGAPACKATGHRALSAVPTGWFAHTPVHTRYVLLHTLTDPRRSSAWCTAMLNIICTLLQGHALKSDALQPRMLRAGRTSLTDARVTSSCPCAGRRRPVTWIRARERKARSLRGLSRALEALAPAQPRPAPTLRSAVPP